MDKQPIETGSGRSILSHIGSDAGALILFTSPTLTGHWIDLTPANTDESQVRGAVFERDLPQGVAFAAVYPQLRQGVYSIEGSNQIVTITSGRVTTLDYLEDCCRIYYHPSTMSVLVDKR
ncbi:MAG: hypothetical protein HKL85_02970 [Acidimicrobiaceae bacterium]|nr:hypothetical protein [Acidimicrobiaceae bacterium]